MSELAGLGVTSYLQACTSDKRELIIGLAACHARRRALSTGSSAGQHSKVQPQEREVQELNKEVSAGTTQDTDDINQMAKNEARLDRDLWKRHGNSSPPVQGATQDRDDMIATAKTEARPNPRTCTDREIQRGDSNDNEKNLLGTRAVERSDRECHKLQQLVLAVAEEAKPWRPAAVASWLSRLEAISTLGDAGGNMLSKPEAVLEQDDWRRPALLDPALGGARAAAVRRSEAQIKKLHERAERLKAENERLRLRCAGAGGGVGLRGDRSSWAADEEEVQRLCSQAIKLAQRVAELQQTRTSLQERLAACKKDSLLHERALLARFPKSSSQPSLAQAAWDDSGRTGYRQPAQDSYYAQRRILSDM